MPQALQDLETPALLLDEDKMDRNIARMRAQVQRLGVTFRPHVKTNKCIEVSRRLMESPEGPITVSTLLEADYFAEHGVRDILYAVCIAPNKIAHVLALQERGVRMSILVDSVEAARVVGERLVTHPAGGAVGVLIEVDSDGHRSGVQPESDDLLAVARALQQAGVAVRGVLTHAGGSYDCRSPEALRAMAEQERGAVVRAAQRLRAAGFACPVVSVGSTPTAFAAEQLEGVTELRAGAPDALHLPVGTQVRILPNHACSTAAPYPAYQVIGPAGTVRATWPRFNGW